MANKTKSIHVDEVADKVQRIDRDELATLIVDSFNKSQKDGSKVAYFLDEQEDPSMVSDWISTGSTLLDLAISNRKNGGLPCGRLMEISGNESAGKSLMCAHILANTQKKNGLGIMIDSEAAAAPEFWTSIGVNIENLVYCHLVTVEEIFSKIEQAIGVARKNFPDRLITIVVDSIAQASCEKEMEEDHSVLGYNTAKSIIISKACRKIVGLIGKQRILLVFTNQLRMNMNAMAFGDKYTTSGGKALGYASSVRIRLNNIGSIKNSEKEVIGNTCKAVVTKNRMGPPKRSATFSIYFDSGIQDLSSWLDFLKEKNIISGNKAGYLFKLSSGEIKLSSSEFVKKINEDSLFKGEIYDIICDKQIMEYRDPNSKIEENVEEDDSVDED